MNMQTNKPALLLAVPVGLAALGALTLARMLPAQAAEGNPTTLNVAAPELTGGPWLNTPPDAKGKASPVTLAARRGKVTIVHFWTFACVNCKANLPAYA